MNTSLDPVAFRQSRFPFFVGRGRSGTTLLMAMLNSHPDIAIPYESHFVLDMALQRTRYEEAGEFQRERFLADLFSDWSFARWNLPEEPVTSAFADFSPTNFADAVRVVYSVNSHCRGKTLYGEKAPGFVTQIPLLARVFPESCFVHVIRDGRNVALSYLEGGWGPKNLEEAAFYWKRFVERGRSAGRELGPERYIEVRYEELLENAEGTLSAICRHIDLEFDDAMLRYFERADVVPAKLPPHLVRGHQNLKLPPTKGLRDWRREMTGEQAGLFEAIAGDLLNDLGYELSHVRVAPSIRLSARSRLLTVHARRALRRARKTKIRKQLRARIRAPFSFVKEEM